eukprot:gb/GECG01002852.1/.p1 GENE.gb/GECG01002852.1/~~gb/GECG01002852.1/.p1  ORF type:complete len:1424 (+),score=184.63 gb/GECG01002852.1/:1-4272(+)
MNLGVFFPLDSNVMEQNDANEFYQLFMDRLGEVFPHKAARSGSVASDEDNNCPDLLQRTLGGTLAHQIIGQHVDYVSERSEPFMCIQLEVASKTDIYESLDSFVSSEVLSGDNAYELPSGERVSVFKRCCFRRLPNTLVFHLKRFDLDFDTFEKVKIYSRFEFEHRINLWQYTAQYLAEDVAKKESAQTSNGESPMPGYEPEDPDDCEYVLRGVLVHSGTAEYGHYYSYVHERDSDAVSRTTEDPWESMEASRTSQERAPKWICFNDDVVYEIEDVASVKSRWFGGSRGDRKYEESMTSAFMLFYDRVGSSDPYGDMECSTAVSTSENAVSAVVRRQGLDSTSTPVAWEPFWPHSAFLQLREGVFRGLVMPHSLACRVVMDNCSFWIRRRLCEGWFQRLVTQTANILLEWKQLATSQTGIVYLGMQEVRGLLPQNVLLLIDFLLGVDIRRNTGGNIVESLAYSPETISRKDSVTEQAAGLVGITLSYSQNTKPDDASNVFAQSCFDVESCIHVMQMVSSGECAFLRRHLCFQENIACRKFATAVVLRVIRSLDTIAGQLTDAICGKEVSFDDVFNATAAVYPRETTPPAVVLAERRLSSTPVQACLQINYSDRFRPWSMFPGGTKHRKVKRVRSSHTSYTTVKDAIGALFGVEQGDDALSIFLRIVASLSQFLGSMSVSLPHLLSDSEIIGEEISELLEGLLASCSPFFCYAAAQQGLVEILLSLYPASDSAEPLVDDTDLQNADSLRNALRGDFENELKPSSINFMRTVAAKLEESHNSVEKKEDALRDVWSRLRCQRSDEWSSTVERYLDEELVIVSPKQKFDCFCRLRQLFFRSAPSQPLVPPRLFTTVHHVLIRLATIDSSSFELPPPLISRGQYAYSSSFHMGRQPPLSISETIFDCTVNGDGYSIDPSLSAQRMARSSSGSAASGKPRDDSEPSYCSVRLQMQSLPSTLLSVCRSIHWFDQVILFSENVSHVEAYFGHVSYGNARLSRRICEYLMWSIARERFDIETLFDVLFPVTVSLLKLSDGLDFVRFSWLIGPVEPEQSGESLFCKCIWHFARYYLNRNGATPFLPLKSPEEGSEYAPEFKTRQDMINEFALEFESESSADADAVEFGREYSLLTILAGHAFHKADLLEVLDKLSTERRDDSVVIDTLKAAKVNGTAFSDATCWVVMKLIYLLCKVHTEDEKLKSLKPELSFWMRHLMVMIGDKLGEIEAYIEERRKFTQTEKESKCLKLCSLMLDQVRTVFDGAEESVAADEFLNDLRLVNDEEKRSNGAELCPSPFEQSFVPVLSNTRDFLREYSLAEDINDLEAWYECTLHFLHQNVDRETRDIADLLAKEVRSQMHRNENADRYFLSQLEPFFIAVVHRYSLSEKHFGSGKRDRSCDIADPTVIELASEEEDDFQQKVNTPSKRRRRYQ